MNTYIDLLRNIVKNFDGEFNNVIKKILIKILIKIFNDYYMNRNSYKYCIDNLYKKFYVAKYNKIMKKYGSIKKDDLIFRFNRYNKKACIIKLMKENFRVILDENETYESVSDMILQKTDIKNYKRYIDNMFIEIDLSVKKVCNDNNDEIKKEVVKKDNINIFRSQICFYPPCLKWVSQGNYCHSHSKDMI